jgi:ParB family chromosome partitioning protein
MKTKAIINKTEIDTNKIDNQKADVLDRGESNEISISKIDFSPLNYRKFFSESDMQNFAMELALHGIISPLTVRPMPSGRFELVAGERRLRAAKIAKFKVVPVIIRQLTDQQVIEIQLSENLQRENPHPLHEAEAIGMMQKKCMTIEEIAGRLGKSKQFVYTRLKLLALISAFKEMVFQNTLSLNDALQIATLSETSQTEFFEEHCKDWKKNKNFRIGNLEYYLDRYRYDLRNAPFDIKDKNLLSEAGNCSTCPSNSATLKSLFPDYAKRAICSNSQCYNKKCSIHFLTGLKEAIAAYEPTAILHYNQLSEADEKLLLLGTEGSDLPRYNYHEVTTIEKPEKPEKEHFTYEDEKGKPRLDKEEYNEVLEQYESLLETYNLNLKSGHFKVALLLESDKFVPVHFNLEKPKKSNGTVQTKTAKEVQEAIKAGSATPELLKAEIDRIKQREERAKELDKEKVQLTVHNVLSEHAAELDNNKELTKADLIGARLIIYQSLEYFAREKVRAVLFPENKSRSMIGCEHFFKVMTNLSDQQYSYLIRMAICSKSDSKFPMSDAGYCLCQMAREAGLPVEEIENKQAAKAKERKDKQDNKIKGLKKKINKMK